MLRWKHGTALHKEKAGVALHLIGGNNSVNNEQ